MKKILETFFFAACISGCIYSSDPAEKKAKTDDAVSVNILQLKSSDSLSLLIRQNWRVTDAQPPQPKDLEAFGRNNNGQPSLYIVNNNSLLENPLGTNIRLGKYILRDRSLQVTFDDGGKTEFVIKRATPTMLNLRRLENGKESLLTLQNTGWTYKEPKDNPFLPEYHQWRIKPATAEDHETLIRRLKNYMEFNIKFFEDFLDRNLKTMDFGRIPSCFNWYKGGIGIQSEKNLDEKWISCFYSKEQALKAREILEKAVLRKHKWVPNVPNWVEQTLPVLKSIKDSL